MYLSRLNHAQSKGTYNCKFTDAGSWQNFLPGLGLTPQMVFSASCSWPNTPLEKRAETTYAEYRRQKASGSGGRGFRLPLW
jgi:hypothetical protein